MHAGRHSRHGAIKTETGKKSLAHAAMTSQRHASLRPAQWHARRRPRSSHRIRRRGRRRSGAASHVAYSRTHLSCSGPSTDMWRQTRSQSPAAHTNDSGRSRQPPRHATTGCIHRQRSAATRLGRRTAREVSQSPEMRSRWQGSLLAAYRTQGASLRALSRLVKYAPLPRAWCRASGRTEQRVGRAGSRRST